MSLTVNTPYGRVEGVRIGKVRRWLGIPYAQAQRFGPPVAPHPWHGVRNAVSLGPYCPQNFGALKADAPEVSEDCLNLNIWAPAGNAPSLKPVVVWIHGGAFMGGSSAPYDGADFAARGDIVVVTINYRLGVLGFVNFGAALGDTEIVSNLGLRDQISALEWVRDNIAAFGGNPGQVTVMGESAGSMSISLLMLSSRAASLFHGAIMQSGALNLIHDANISIKIAKRYCALLNIDPGDTARLRSLALKDLLTAQARVQSEFPGNVPAAPWYDGDLLPRSLDAAREHTIADIPLLAGFNREEIRTFELMPGPKILPMRRNALEGLLRQQLPRDVADTIVSVYPDTRQGNRQLATHLTFGLPTLHFAERHSRHSPTWFYRFDYSHFLAGAAHGLELAFLWNFKGSVAAFFRGGYLTGKRKSLSERMRAHWIDFIRHGQPGPDWPDFTPDYRQTKVFNLTDHIKEDTEGSQRKAWGGADVSTNVS